MSAKWIDLVNVRVPPIMGGVYDDFKVIIQFLGDIPPQFCSNDFLRLRVKAGDAEVDVTLGVQNADFGFLRRRLSLEGLALQKVRDWRGLLP